MYAIGQILYYATYYPKHNKRIHLFNHKNKRDDRFDILCESSLREPENRTSLDIIVSYE